MIIKQITVFVENKTGKLARITEVIGEAGIDIRALSIADTSDFGILRLIVDNPEDAAKALSDADFPVSMTDVIAVGIDDTPGAFAKVARLMSDAELDIEYLYAFVSRAENKAFVILRIENTGEAIRVLNEHGIPMPDSKEIYGM